MELGCLFSLFTFKHCAEIKTQLIWPKVSTNEMCFKDLECDYSFRPFIYFIAFFLGHYSSD